MLVLVVLVAVVDSNSAVAAAAAAIHILCLYVPNFDINVKHVLLRKGISLKKPFI